MGPAMLTRSDVEAGARLVVVNRLPLDQRTRTNKSECPTNVPIEVVRLDAEDRVVIRKASGRGKFEVTMADILANCRLDILPTSWDRLVSLGERWPSQ